MLYIRQFSIIIFFICTSSLSADDQNTIAFINLDLLVKKSELGIKIYSDLEKKKNIELKKINEKENNIKKIDAEIKNKKNVLTKDEFKREIDFLKKEISEFNIYKKKIQNDFEKEKKKRISEFFKMVNPLIQEFLDKNSIDILLNNKYVVIGKNNLDITENIIEIINNKLD